MNDEFPKKGMLSLVIFTLLHTTIYDEYNTQT